MLLVKIFDRPGEVKLNRQGNPCRVLLRDEWQEVLQLLDRWAYTGQWWAGENEKMFYRLLLEKGQIIEIYQDIVDGKWSLYKIYD